MAHSTVSVVSTRANSLGVDPRVAAAIMAIESSWGTNSSIGAGGVSAVKNPLQATKGSATDLFKHYAKHGRGEARRVAQAALRKGSSKNWSRTDWINAGLLHIKRAQERGVPIEHMGAAHLGGIGGYLKNGLNTEVSDHFGTTPAGHNNNYLTYLKRYMGGGSSSPVIQPTRRGSFYKTLVENPW